MRSRRLSALLPALALIAGLLGGVTAPAAGSATCVPAPTLREAEFNQGLPYRSEATGAPVLLAAGKDTIVRLHMTLPDCTVGLSGQSAKITSATLTAPGLPTYQSAPVTDTVPACCTASNNSYGDPKFKVPGTDLAATGNVSFVATITYTSSGAAGTQTLTINDATNPDPRLVAGFFATTNWKTLVVPLGAAGQSYCAWFPTTSQACPGYSGANYASVLQQAEAAASRILAVRSGVCNPIPDTATNAALAANCGIQYTLSGDLADMGPGGANVLPKNSSGVATTPFCGGSMSKIAPVLDKHLQAYNEANPTAQADSVMGVVPDSKSSGCTTQGMAVGGGDESWVRLIPDSSSANTGGVSVSGAVLAQEQSHNRQIENNQTRHSTATRADGVYPHRFVNTVSTTWDDNNKTVLAADLVGIGANNNNTGLEDDDWKCLLIGIPAQDRSACGVQNGTTVAASQSPTFSITGRLSSDGTAANVTSLSFSDNQERGLDGSSSLQLAFLNTNTSTTLKTQGIYVGRQETHPNQPDPDGAVFDAATTVPTGTDRIELRNNGQTLWWVNISTAPSGVQVYVRPDRFGFLDLGAGTDPSVSPFSPESNVLVTWVGGTCGIGAASGHQLMVERAAGGATASACIPGQAPLSPHFGSGDSQIFYVTQYDPATSTGGDIQAISFTPSTSTNPSTSPGTFGAATTIYNCAPQGQLCKPGNVTQTNVGPATDIDVSQDGQIVFSADQGPSLGGGDLFLIRNPVAGLAVPLRLTLSSSRSETSPSFSHTNGQQLIVFERCCETGGASGLYTLDYSSAIAAPDTGSGSRALRVQGHNPSWGYGFIAAEQGGVVSTIFPDDASVVDPQGKSPSIRPVAGPGTDHPAPSFDPSLRASGGPVAFESGNDVWVASSSHLQSEVSVIATDPDGSLNSTGNTDDFAEIFAETTRNADGSSPCSQSCSLLRQPVGVVVPQASRQGDQITFHKVVDLAAVPLGSVAQASVSDYFSTATSFGNANPPSFSAADKLQSAVISYPAPGTIAPSDQPLWFDGSATDPELGTVEYASGNRALTFTWKDELGNVLSHEPRFFLPTPPVGTHTYTLVVTDSSAQQTVTSTANVGVTVEKRASGALFQPNTYQVPSNGTLSYFATLAGVTANKLKVTNAAITRIDGVPVWQYGSKSLPFTASWTNLQDAFTFKISRDSTTACSSALAPPGTSAPCQSLNNFLLANGKVDGAIHVFTLEGTLSNGTRFIVEDDDHPSLIPA